jgi:aldehyde dehydrogenase (NAD+)
MIDWTLGYLENFNWEQDIGNYESVGILSKRIVRKEAAGVVAAITPWNFPLQIILAKVIPALAAGCTVVLKSAPDTPWTASVLGRIAKECTDLPAGVFNVITSEDPVATGNLLVESPKVDVVSFTGSTAVGKAIMAKASTTLKKVFLELGGKSANIVLEDADLASSLLSCLAVCFHAGQGCAIPTRLLVPKSKLAEAEALLKSYFAFISYGKPDSDEIMGPLISATQRERVLQHIANAKADGARLLLGGKAADLAQGYYVEPTVFTEVDPDSRLAQEEVFGPVLAVMTYENEEQAIAIANNSMYGLSAMVWSATDEHALDVARKIRTGTVNINGGNFLAPDAPFGGYKQSGLGREMGPEGFAEYLEVKTLAVKVEV